MLFKKRYSTIVAVGGMELINRVARAIEPFDVVFGIIPTTEHPDLARLVGVADWRAAAEQLKRRRWQAMRLGLINNQVCFLTPATIVLENSTKYHLRTPDFELKGSGGLLTISPVRNVEESPDQGLIIDIQPLPEKKSLLGSLFGGAPKESTESRFTVTELALSTDHPLPVTIAGANLAATPIHCSTQAKVLKIIVAKGGVA